jgi:hypothetical protein
MHGAAPEPILKGTGVGIAGWLKGRGSYSMNATAEAHRVYRRLPTPNDLRGCSCGCLALVGGAPTCLVCEARAAGQDPGSDPREGWQLIAVLESLLRIQYLQDHRTCLNSVFGAVSASAHAFSNSCALNRELAGASCVPHPQVSRLIDSGAPPFAARGDLRGAFVKE